MLTDIEINRPAVGDPGILPVDVFTVSDPKPEVSSYRDRLNRWAIARVDDGNSPVIIERFRSHSDAEGHLKFLRQQFPLAEFIILVKK